MKMTLQDAADALHGSLVQGDPAVSFEHVSIDTRTLQAGDLFFAIRGPRHDGHDHLREAANKGAIGAVVQKISPRARRSCPRLSFLRAADTIAALQDLARFIRSQCRADIVGITGTNGKTTTKEMAASILSRAGKTLSTRGNFNNHLGLPLSLTDLRPDHRFAVLEMGSSLPGDIGLLVDIARPRIGLITNIGKGHLRRLKTLEGVLREKRTLFDALPKEGVAVVNTDDPLLGPLARSLRCRVVTFGLTGQADVRAERMESGAFPIRFVLNAGGARAPVKLSIPGHFQVLNALAAAGVAQALGVPASDIAAGLESFRPVAMRMQVLTHGSGAVLINDAYNANPSSVRASVTGLCQSFPERTRWVVLGEMRELGRQARSEHEELGQWLAARPVDRILFYGKEGRSVLRGARSAVSSPPHRPTVECFSKKRYLIAELQRSLTGGEAVLFKASRAVRLEEVVNALLPVRD